MAILDHEPTFAGLPIREYDPAGPIGDAAAVAYRLSQVGDGGAAGGPTVLAKLDRFLDDPGSGRATALVVGMWGYGGEAAEAIVEALAAASPRLPGLRAVFLGDISPEECEAFEISLPDLGPLLAAYPALEQLRARGGDDLGFGCPRHDGLRSLIVEAGALDPESASEFGEVEWPRLEHLELWLGDEDFFEPVGVDDLAPIFSGERLPALRSLGLRNAAIADAVAVALADSAILGRIEALDLSLGTLGDEGAIALLESGKLAGLKRLDISHHYVSDEVLDGLKALGIELRHDDGFGPNARRSVVVHAGPVDE